MNKKYVKWGLIAFVVWYLVNDPDGAAAAVNNAAAAVGKAFDSLSRFANGLG